MIAAEIQLLLSHWTARQNQNINPNVDKDHNRKSKNLLGTEGIPVGAGAASRDGGMESGRKAERCCPLIQQSRGTPKKTKTHQEWPRVQRSPSTSAKPWVSNGAERLPKTERPYTDKWSQHGEETLWLVLMTARCAAQVRQVSSQSGGCRKSHPVQEGGGSLT